MSIKNKILSGVLAIIMLLCCLIITTGCIPNGYSDEVGYWITDDGSMILDSQSSIARIIANDTVYYFDWDSGSSRSKLQIRNSFFDYPIVGDNTIVLSGKVESYKTGSGVLKVKVESDDYFNKVGETIIFKLKTYSEATSFLYNNDGVWKNEDDDAIYNFNDKTCNGLYYESTYNGSFDTFPTNEIIQIIVTIGEGSSTQYSAYIAEVITKTDNEITLTILAADGIFAGQVGETITLTKQID